MNITRQPRKKLPPEYYIYYNDWTGEIVTVGRSKRDCPAPFIIVNDDIAQKILDGEECDSNYLVSSDFSKKRQLIKKSEVLQLRKREDSLFLVPRKRDPDADITMKLYTGNNTLVIEVNPAIISRLMSFNMRKDLKSNVKATLDFFITKKDNPDFYLYNLKVSANELVKYGKVVYDVSDLVKFAAFSDIDIITRRYFEKYSLQIINDSFVDMADDAALHLYKNKWQVVTEEINSHLLITQMEDVALVSSAITAEQFNSLQLYETSLKFHAVKKDNPDEFVQTFDIDITRLRMGKLERVAINFDIMECDILYQNPKMKVSKRKI